MLRITPNTSSAVAKSYFSTADYYSEGQELQGIWRGKGAQLLGLSGTVEQKEWDRLCDNLHPMTGEPLTIRRKQERRVGFDFTFDVPKSVSLLYGISRDERILDAFRDSVRETMDEIEAEMQTRVRKHGKNEDRVTGNMVLGEYTHFTSRPVDGLPDPHLHTHCFVFNATWDDAENRWKAGQFGDLKRDAPYFQAVCDSKLATRLGQLGLAVERTKQGWDLSGFDRSTLEKFARRTEQIEAEAQRKGIRDADAKAALGAMTREHKQKHLTLDELRREWQSRLDDVEESNLTQCIARSTGPSIPEIGSAAREGVEFAASHCFERKSVVPERMVLAAALNRSLGAANRDNVNSEFQRYGFFVGNRDGRRMATTKEVLAEEQHMIDFARRGRGTRRALASEPHEFKRTWLNDDQRKAVEHILQSPDRVVLVRGAAGVGKTTMMQEAAEAIEKSGIRVFTFAPSADASRGTLRQEGFETADTVARLLLDEQLQAEVRGQVVWIDEAGLLGTGTMTRVFDLAEKLDARVILSGDRRQHGSVERGAALRLLEQEAGLVPAEIREIQRQKGNYKDAIRMLSEGDVEGGFKHFDRMGWIRESPADNRYQDLASDYVATCMAGESALVVSPTHYEGERITSVIREKLRYVGQLGKEEVRVRTLHSLDLTEGERADAANYAEGDVLEFHQNAKGFVKGEQVTVGPSPLPLEHAARFQVYRAGELNLSSGDIVRITKNGTTADKKHRLSNGSLHRIRGFDQRGNLILQNGWKVSKDFGHLAYGYCVTSHASQGKTVDRVFIGQSAESFSASSREQFYVSASRGRYQVIVYTDDKEALLEAVKRSDPRLSATQLVAESSQRDRTAITIRRTMLGPDSMARDLESIRRQELIYDR